MTTITRRTIKGSSLTFTEVEDNWARDALTQTTPYTVVTDDNRATVECSSAGTLTLPAAATIVPASGDPADFEVTVKNVSGGVVTVVRTGADLIDGGGSWALADDDSFTFKVNNARNGWNIISRKLSNVVTLTAGQTLTNKTLTSPTINTPNLSSDSVDAITEVAAAIKTGTGSKLVTNDRIPKYVTGAGAYVSSTQYDLSTPADATWTSIGTGQWSALSSIPTDADWIEVRIRMQVSLSATTVLQSIAAVATGELQTASGQNVIAYAQYGDGAVTTKTLNSTVTTKIPVATRSFDIYVSSAGATNSSTMWLMGYGYNS